MSKLASVTVLRPRDEPVEPAPTHVSGASREDYWERLQALRAELAELQGAS